MNTRFPFRTMVGGSMGSMIDVQITVDVQRNKCLDLETKGLRQYAECKGKSL
jgi:hypothetical protein